MLSIELKNHRIPSYGMRDGELFFETLPGSMGVFEIELDAVPAIGAEKFEAVPDPEPTPEETPEEVFAEKSRPVIIDLILIAASHSGLDFRTLKRAIGMKLIEIEQLADLGLKYREDDEVEDLVLDQVTSGLRVTAGGIADTLSVDVRQVDRILEEMASRDLVGVDEIRNGWKAYRHGIRLRPE